VICVHLTTDHCTHLSLTSLSACFSVFCYLINLFFCFSETIISGPVLVMVLEKDNAIADWRTLMGPTDASKAKITHPHRSYNVTNLITSHANFITCSICVKLSLLALMITTSDNLLYCFLQYQSKMWIGYRKELCSWFRLS